MIGYYILGVGDARDGEPDSATAKIQTRLEQLGFSWDGETTIEWSVNPKPGQIATYVGPFRWCELISTAISACPDLADRLLVFLGKELAIIQPRALFNYLMIVPRTEAGRTNGEFIRFRLRNPDEQVFTPAAGNIGKAVSAGHESPS